MLLTTCSKDLRFVVCGLRFVVQGLKAAAGEPWIVKVEARCRDGSSESVVSVKRV